MEQSRLISSVIAKLKIAYPYYFKELKTEELAGMISLYREFLSEYNELTLNNAIKSIISKSKYMPSINELINECEALKKSKAVPILDTMLKDGYFKKGIYELEVTHATRNYEKALMWMEQGIIPDWLLEDMKKYGFIEDKKVIYTNSFRQLGLNE